MAAQVAVLKCQEINCLCRQSRTNAWQVWVNKAWPHASGLGNQEARFTLSPGLLQCAHGGDLFGNTPSLAAIRVLAPFPHSHMGAFFTVPLKQVAFQFSSQGLLLGNPNS